MAEATLLAKRLAEKSRKVVRVVVQQYGSRLFALEVAAETRVRMRQVRLVKRRRRKRKIAVESRIQASASEP